MLSIPHERVPEFDELGLLALTTTRDAGSFNLGSQEPSADVYGRWWRLFQELAPWTRRLASAHQVHGTDILVHSPHWHGWLRAPAADGHAAFDGATAMTVSLADCIPVFIGHRSGAAALLHSGWRGTAAGIATLAVAMFHAKGFRPVDLVVHLGPGICGRCYVVGTDVYERLTQHSTSEPAAVDLRAIIAAQLRDAGVRSLTISDWCTRCHNDHFFSHRAGDEGRQLAVLSSGVVP